MTLKMEFSLAHCSFLAHYYLPLKVHLRKVREKQRDQAYTLSEPWHSDLIYWLMGQKSFQNTFKGQGKTLSTFRPSDATADISYTQQNVVLIRYVAYIN